MLETNILAFDIAEIMERLAKDAEIDVFLLGAAGVLEHADHRHLVRG